MQNLVTTVMFFFFVWLWDEEIPLDNEDIYSEEEEMF